MGWAEETEEEAAWRTPSGIFVIVVIRGAAGERIRELQKRYDPKLAATNPPHLTLIGSSGVGPIVPSASTEEIRRLAEPIAASTPPIELTFGAPVRFMQTNIVVLPLPPHGALRTLHDRLARSGLPLGTAKHAFTPHATLTFFRTLPRDELRELLATRVTEPLIVDHLLFSLTDDPNPTKDLFELPLRGEL